MKNLREARKSAGIKTMRIAATLAGVPYRTWSGWERGEARTPPIIWSWLRQYETIARLRRYVAALEEFHLPTPPITESKWLKTLGCP